VDLIRLRRLCKTYHMGREVVRALRGVNLTIHQGEFIAIMGPSGSGKSTLMHVLGLLDIPDSGEYELAGARISRLSEDELAGLRGRTIGFIFQQFNLLPRLTALENVQLPLLYAPGGTGADPRKIVKQVGLASRSGHRPSEMSGGQQQRVAIARSLINRPQVILADEPTGNLDTATQKEILEILARLNRSGLTVIMVTHEPDVAAWARRIIRMRDGRIVADERRPARASGGPKLRRLGRPIAVRTSGPEDLGGWRVTPAQMAVHSREALRSLASNKVRASLSGLGIAIGVAAVIAVLALGAGARASVMQTLARFGANVMSVRPNWWGPRGWRENVTRLTREDALAIPRAHPAIKRTVPTIWGMVGVTANGQSANTSLIGATPLIADLRAYHPTMGRFFTNREEEDRARVCLLGLTVARNLFGTGTNPVGREVRINRIPFRVIGILPEKGYDGHRDNDDLVLAPLGTAMYRVLGERYIGNIDVDVAPEANMKEVEESLKGFLARRYRLSGEKEDSFEIRNEAAQRAARSETSQTITILLDCIAAISLLVGGIGIMNIMLVSVTERTREIGLRKAIGARPRDIMFQFLVESVIISAIGGGLGIILGCASALLVTFIFKWTVIITPSSILLSAGFSMLIGIVFGWWPARRAASLAPVDALRYE